MYEMNTCSACAQATMTEPNEARTALLAAPRRGFYHRSVTIALVGDEVSGWLVARATGSIALSDILEFLRTARADVESRGRPLLFDARGATTTMRLDDVDVAVAMVTRVIASHGARGYVALVADDDPLYAWALAYEAKCALAGVRVIRVFRQRLDAEQWLQIMASAGNFASF
jgi:hypothetical protein